MKVLGSFRVYLEVNDVAIFLVVQVPVLPTLERVPLSSKAGAFMLLSFQISQFLEVLGNVRLT